MSQHPVSSFSMGTSFSLGKAKDFANFRPGNHKKAREKKQWENIGSVKLEKTYDKVLGMHEGGGILSNGIRSVYAN